MTVLSERGNEQLYAMKGIEFTEQLTKKHSVPWCVLIIEYCKLIINLKVPVRFT
jgi:hypothetical protein